MVITEIYIIRHAEADGNIYRRYHGWFNSNLTLNGQRQVEMLKHKLSGMEFDAVYSSNLRRCMTTAQAAATYCKGDIIPDTRLREIGGGVWEDMAFGNMNRDYDHVVGRFDTDPTACAEGGESAQEVFTRLSDFIHDVIPKHEGQSICLVTHGLAGKLLLSTMLHGDIEKRNEVPRILNASISKLLWQDGRFTPVYINNCGHLSSCPTVAPDCELLFESCRQDGVRVAVDCWKKTWQVVHGNTLGFGSDFAHSELRRMLTNNRNAIRFAYDGKTLAGVVALDTANIEEDDCGHISLLMLNAEYRRRGLGAQLVGEAASIYRGLGRKYLRLRADRTNQPALNFYKRLGYTVSGKDGGGDYILKKYISHV